MGLVANLINNQRKSVSMSRIWKNFHKNYMPTNLHSETIQCVKFIKKIAVMPEIARKAKNPVKTQTLPIFKSTAATRILVLGGPIVHFSARSGY